MLGYYVDQPTINQMAAQAALGIRSAFAQVETFNNFLNDRPIVSNVDPLVAEFGYTTAEAATLRLYFQNMHGIPTANQTTFDMGRKFTALQ
jgi:hypothetical protein